MDLSKFEYLYFTFYMISIMIICKYCKIMVEK